MPPSARIILELPLTQIWDDEGPIEATRLHGLVADEIRELLRTARIRFLIADVGFKPRWAREAETFDFWKREVLPHIADIEEAHLEEFPDNYCYFATLWRNVSGGLVVVLEKHH